jgi:hypothetical protein
MAVTVAVRLRFIITPISPKKSPSLSRRGGEWIRSTSTSPDAMKYMASETSPRRTMVWRGGTTSGISLSTISAITAASTPAKIGTLATMLSVTRNSCLRNSWAKPLARIPVGNAYMAMPMIIRRPPKTLPAGVIGVTSP